MNRIKCFLGFWMTIFFLLCFIPSSFSATVDVMIVYDLTAKSWVDSHAGMSTFAASAVARMNQALANSGVTTLTFRLVNASQVSYTYATGDEGATLGDALYFLRSSTTVSTLRTTCGADVVVMLVDTGSAYGTVGLGYELTNPSGSPNYAYSVSAIRSVYESETMTHEVGHNFGCGHSKEQVDSPGPGIFSYSAGWYFSDYSSIMAYNDKNGDGYADYIEASYFSNPDVTFAGDATGNAANGDNARTLEETAAVVAAYRSSTTSTSSTTTTTTTTSSSSTSTSSTSTTSSTFIPDITPNPFTFTGRTNVPLSTTVTSNTITVSGINTGTTISITGGTYSVNGGTIYTSDSGTVYNGYTVTVQLTSSSSYAATTSAILTIGGVSGTFSVTTITTADDSTPNAFTFTDQTNVPLSTEIISNAITVSGINTAAVISIVGGTYSVNGGTYRSASYIVNNGATVTVKQTSSASYSTKTDATLNIGGVSDTFSVTTLASPGITSPDAFTFDDVTDVAPNTEITSNTITVSGINTAVPISITGGTYSINGAVYTNESGSVNNGDTVAVRQTSSEDYSATTDATLNISGVTDTFSVTTEAEPAGSKDSGGGGGGCFIATAAFGSPMAGQVEILRQFRDRYLLTNAPGKKFVAWYYRNGPVAASFIKDKPLAKAAVRAGLYPLIGFSLLLISGYMPLAMSGLLLSALLYVRFRPRKSIIR